MLLNQYDKKTKFYTQADIEYLMGFIAKKNKNIYTQDIYAKSASFHARQE